MDLDQLIAHEQSAQPADESLLKLLTDIRKLDAKRAANAFKLRTKTLQIGRRLDRSVAEASEADEALRVWLAQYDRQLEEAVVRQRQQFGGDLADRLAPQGLRLKGQYPKLSAGLFTFTLNFEKGRCAIWYGPEQEKLSETALDAAKVADTARKLWAKLGSGLEPLALLAKLDHAYRHARLDRTDGPLLLTALLPYMAWQVQNERFRSDPRKDRYRGYGRADFSYDLFRMRGVSPAFRLAIATRQQATKRGNFLWVPAREDVEGGDYFATLDVKEEKS
jgi:hypothetical protein